MVEVGQGLDQVPPASRVNNDVRPSKTLPIETILYKVCALLFISLSGVALLFVFPMLFLL